MCPFAHASTFTMSSVLIVEVRSFVDRFIIAVQGGHSLSMRKLVSQQTGVEDMLSNYGIKLLFCVWLKASPINVQVS